MSNEVTAKTVQAAYEKGLKRIEKDQALTSTATSAGFHLEGKKKERVGYQVFVKIIRYSDEQLAEDRESGGLAVRP